MEELERVLDELLSGRRKREAVKNTLLRLRYAFEAKIGRDFPDFRAVEHLVSSGFITEREARELHASDEVDKWGREVLERLEDYHPGLLALALAAIEKAYLERKSLKEIKRFAKSVLRWAKDVDEATLEEIARHKAYVDDVVRYIVRENKANDLYWLLRWMETDEGIGRLLRRALGRVLESGWRQAVAKEGRKPRSVPELLREGGVERVIKYLKRRYAPAPSPRDLSVWRIGGSAGEEPPAVPRPEAAISFEWLIQHQPHEHVEELVYRAGKTGIPRKKDRIRTAKRVLYKGNAFLLRGLGKEK